jgi:Mrp family chromosome partitioning ATPase/capsular polysaccharide biosynthesis protein
MQVGHTLERSGQSSSVLSAVLRYRWGFLVALVVAVAIGYGVSFLQETTYEAEGRLLLSDPRSTVVFSDATSPAIDPARYVRNQAEYIESTTVASRAAEMLGGAIPPQDLRDRSRAEASLNVDLITITATGRTPEAAKAYADALGAAYIELSAEQLSADTEAAIAELQRTKEELQERADVLDGALAADPDDAALQAEREAVVARIIDADTRIERIEVNSSLYGTGVQLHEQADLPTSPIRPRPLLGAAAGLLIGLFGGALGAWWRSERNPLAVDPRDPAPILGTPLLGVIPEFAGLDGSVLPTITHRDSPAAEAYQFVLSGLGLTTRTVTARLIAVTSPLDGDGKTVAAMNLAVAAHTAGSHALLIEADMRNRGLSNAAGRSTAAGLADLGSNEDLSLCMQRWRPAGSIDLPVIPAGSTDVDPAGFFRSDSFGRAVDVIRQHAESEGSLVLIDTPPLLAAAEASDIAARADAAVLVVRRGTPLRTLDDVRHQLELVQVPLLGYVFNRAATGGPQAYGGYGVPSSGPAGAQG